MASFTHFVQVDSLVELNLLTSFEFSVKTNNIAKPSVSLIGLFYNKRVHWKTTTVRKKGSLAQHGQPEPNKGC